MTQNFYIVFRSQFGRTSVIFPVKNKQLQPFKHKRNQHAGYASYRTWVKYS